MGKVKGTPLHFAKVSIGGEMFNVRINKKGTIHKSSLKGGRRH